MDSTSFCRSGQAELDFTGMRKHSEKRTAIILIGTSFTGIEIESTDTDQSEVEIFVAGVPAS
jgi:hypothetical protein